ncbi:MAG: nuclear transport factor 2 family protein [Actinomycetota bacterium]
MASSTATPPAAVDAGLLHRDGWTPTEQQNVGMIASFVQALMNDHDFDRVRSDFSASGYVQHNRNLGEGIEGVIESVSGLSKRSPEFSYDVKHVYADGDIVIFHSHATLKASHRGDDGKGFNIVDTWRVVDDVIVEHWDSIQPLDLSMRLFVLVSGGRIRNGNGVF